MYKVLVYNGTMGLNAGIFDNFYEAEEYLRNSLKDYLNGYNKSEIEELTEQFYFNSSIKEIRENKTLTEKEMLDILKENRIQVVDLMKRDGVVYRNNYYNVLNIKNGKSWNYTSIKEIYESFLDGDMD